jgi:hypothetical protein
MQNIDSNKSYAWAKRVSLKPSLRIRISALTKDSYTDGKATTDDIQIFDDRVDGVHYRIYKETHDRNNSYWIESLTRNGAVEFKIINNRTIQQLDHGNRIRFLYLSEIKYDVMYSVLLSKKVTNDFEREKNQKLLHENIEHEKHKRICDGQKNDLKCPICLSLISTCMTALPCLFYTSCISDWILGAKMCPNCKQGYSDPRKDFTMTNFIAWI